MCVQHEAIFPILHDRHWPGGYQFITPQVLLQYLCTRLPRTIGVLHLTKDFFKLKIVLANWFTSACPVKPSIHSHGTWSWLTVSSYHPRTSNLVPSQFHSW